MRPARRCGLRFALALTLVIAARRARCEIVEPPPEVEDGRDWEVERADSLASDAVEVEFGAGGVTGQRVRRTQRVAFRGDDLSGSVREGGGDPLSGAMFDARAAGGRLGAGHLAPRWGRGLLLGSPAEPWAAAASDRGNGAPLRGRAGNGAWFRRDGALAMDVLGGRFSRRDLAGARVSAGDASLGLLSGRGRQRQWSAALDRDAEAIELAFDSRGGWRAEGIAHRALAAGTLGLGARAGHAAFRSLAEPLRSGPAQALTATLDGGAGAVGVSALGSLWRFRESLGGARGALELRLRLSHHDAFAVGFEEQQGVRRLPESRAALTRAHAFRQGVWGEWSGAAPGLALTVRHEAWGEQRFARGEVRAASSARIEVSAPFGVKLALAATAFRARRGESLYLADSEGSRLVLRSLSGSGERTRLELQAPAGRGRVRAALNLDERAPRTRAQWTLDWTRRTRASGATPRASP